MFTFIRVARQSSAMSPMGGGGQLKYRGQPHETGICVSERATVHGYLKANPQALCQAPAVRGWAVCRFHGARGGAPKGKANGAYRHGLYTAEAVKERRWMQELLDEVREMVDGIS